jgi:cytoskeletal protein RodZ
MLPSEKKLKEIGESLHRTRVEQNMTLETIVAQTLISKRVIVAIERGNLQELPEPFYIKALLDKYAKAVGYTGVLDYEEPKQEEPKTLSNTQANNPKKPSFQLRSRHLYLIYLFLVIIAVRAIASFVENPLVVDNQIPEEEITLDTEPPINDETPTTVSSASPSQFVSQSNSNNSESVVVDITLKDRCWLKVMVDGKVEFEGTLPQGTQRSWTGKKQIDIIAGNAGGVVVTYNHGQEELLGKPGQVEEVTYTVN